MTPRPSPSRRQFIGTIGTGVGAAALGLRPVFASDRPFAVVPGTPPDDTVRINYNENPYGPSPKALKAIQEANAALASRYFGDDSYEGLSSALAAHHKLKRDNIHVGAGSTEILKICDDVFLAQKKGLVVAEPAYEAVIQYAVNSTAVPTKVPLTADYRHDLARMAAATTGQTGVVYLCNPNNPTATIVQRDELARFMDAVPKSVTVVVDEAYAEFVTDPGYESALRYVREGRNVIVAKTFSKVHGLAGMRIGYAVGSKALIDRIKQFTVDYAITGAAANAAMASLSDVENVATVARLNAAQRQVFFDEMKRSNVVCAASQANFVMVNIRRPVKPVIAEFAKRRILVGREFPAMPTFLRVTLGTEAEMKKFYSAFHEIVRS
jgi:histidinol-phosphate aminotransferase